MSESGVVPVARIENIILVIRGQKVIKKKEKAKVVANCDHLSTLKFSPSLPNAFTEHGAIMAAGIINSPRAIEASIFVVRSFVRLRKMVETHTELLQKVGELEHRLESHDEQIQAIFEAIRQLMTPPETKKKKIGFMVKEKKATYGRRGVKRKKG